MVTTASIPVLLRYYAQRQDSELIDFSEFCEYIKRYAEHHMDEQPDLVTYIGNAEELVRQEVLKLAEAGRAFLTDSKPDRKIIMSEVTAEKIAAKYAQIISSPHNPFPSLTDLPKYYSYISIPQQTAPGFSLTCLTKKNLRTACFFPWHGLKMFPRFYIPQCSPLKRCLKQP